MRLKVSASSQQGHSDLVCGVGWNNGGELYSCSDDQSVQKWNARGEYLGKVCELGCYFSDLQWFPLSAGIGQQSSAGNFVIACTDGTYKLMSKSGRMEKSVDAHRGAVICIRWSHDGTALATGGEDGTVKIWSRTGMLRSTIAQTSRAIYSVGWAPNNDQLIFCQGQIIQICPIQSTGGKSLQWKAHENLILRMEWCAVNGLIVSGGEDCRYKVWDSFGRLLYQSGQLSYPITALAWSPAGATFAVGMYNALILCEKTGCSTCKVRIDSGSIMSIAWTTDGTSLAVGGGNGSVLFGSILNYVQEKNHIRAELKEETQISVYDIQSETTDELDFRDMVVKLSLGYEHLVVATESQCCIYNIHNWNTPHIFDLKGTVYLIVQSVAMFLTVDHVTGIKVYTYEGRQLCNPKAPGLRPELLNEQLISLADDAIAVVDLVPKSDPQTGAPIYQVNFFDTAQGKQIGDKPIGHYIEISAIALNQTGPLTNRYVILVDRQRDLYIAPVLKSEALVKLASMADSVVWHDSTDMLAGMIDQRLMIWYYPKVVYVDRDLMEITQFEKKDREFGNMPQILSFVGARLNIQRRDGATVMTSISPYPLMFFKLMKQNQIEKAVKLCRFVKDATLWACLATIAMDTKDYNTAATAFATLNLIDKLQFVNHIKNIPSEEGRSAEIALYKRRTDEAEQILLQSGLIYRAIKMHVRLYNWETALHIAAQSNQHVDTVVYHRRRYLAAIEQQEHIEAFQKLADLQIDEEVIKVNVSKEKELEMARPRAKRIL